jgi:chaperone required for assembly of F1-ATPase
MPQTLLSPLKNPLVIPLALAQAIAQEAQDEGRVGPALKAKKPLYQLASQAVDWVAPDREKFIAKLNSYLIHDTVCYDQPEVPNLYGHQIKIWGPLREWAAGELEAPIALAHGFEPCRHEPGTLEKMTTLLSGLTDMELSGLMGGCTLTASLIIPLALLKGRLTPKEAFEAACLEELTQNQRWGVEEEALARQALIKTQLDTLAWYFELIEE